MDTFVARQPIFNRRKKIFAYELLYRSSRSDSFPGIDGDVATSNVLTNSFFGVGIDKIVGPYPAFINFTEHLLLTGLAEIFPAPAIVVEVLEDVRPSADVVSACRLLKNKGYTLALDDFIFSEAHAPLVELADIIKVDIQQTPIATIEEQLSDWKEQGIKLLAERVETYEDLHQAQQHHFDYFQGFFFNKPEVLCRKDISGTKSHLLALMIEVNRPGFDFRKIEYLISGDVALTYKLLRFINSAYYSLVSKVTTVSHSLAYLGERDTRLFVTLLATTELSVDKPSELLTTSVIRARFCQLLGEHSGKRIDPAQLFLLGLFSLLDAVLDTDMATVCKTLPLHDTLQEALQKGTGEYAPFLHAVIRYERGDWAGLSKYASDLEIFEKDFVRLYIDAVNWASFFCTP